MRNDEVTNLRCRVATLEEEVLRLRDENKRLKLINRRLHGKQNRRGAPNKVVNILDLFGTVPRVLAKSYSAPLLVRSERKKLQEFLGAIEDGSLENAIYKLRKNICTEMARPIRSDDLEEQLRDLL